MSCQTNVNLLETLAERVADRILLERQAMRVFCPYRKAGPWPRELWVVKLCAPGMMHPAISRRAEVPHFPIWFI